MEKKDILDCLEKFSINQNFIWLVLTFFGIWFANKEGEECMCRVLWVLFMILFVSVVLCAIAYTYEYCVRKCCKANDRKSGSRKEHIENNSSK